MALGELTMTPRLTPISMSIPTNTFHLLDGGGKYRVGPATDPVIGVDTPVHAQM